MSPTVQMPVRLDRALYDDIRKEAEDRSISMAQVIRERLRGVRTESTPADPKTVKSVIMDLLETDAEVIKALKAKA